MQPPHSAEAQLDQLRKALPEGVVATDPAVCENYRHDWWREPGAGPLVAVVRPTDAEQVQTAVRWAVEHRSSART